MEITKELTMFTNSNILLVRHGEKPGDPGQDDPGDGPNLSATGWQRAGAYGSYFQTFTAVAVDGSGNTKSVPIDYVFAAADNYEVSYRPRLTVSLFADAQANPRPLSPCIADKNYADLVSLLGGTDYDSKNILVCWHHGEIIDLANALLTYNGKRAMPALGSASCWPPKGATWPSSVFGWLFQICFDSKGAPDVHWTRCLNEKLMPDDTQDPCQGWPTGAT
jgi:hypothetical protein